MLELPEITIKQYAGWCKGVICTLPMDVVLAHTSRGVRKIAFVNHAPDATVRFIHYMPDKEVSEAIRKRVAELRAEQNGFSVSARTVCPVNPAIVRAHIKGEKLRERPTTIIMPDGPPAGEGEKHGESPLDDWRENNGG